MPRKKPSDNGVAVVPDPSPLRLAMFLGSWQSDAERVEEWDFRPELLRDAVLACLSAGCAIQLGMNRARDSVAVNVWDNGERMPFGYHKDAESLSEQLEGLILIMTKYRDQQRAKPS